MTSHLKSINTTILLSALVTFALITGQPYSSNASEQPDHDEIIDHVYSPAWIGPQDPLPRVKVKSEPLTSVQLGDNEMINHVYTPAWMGSQEPSQVPQGEVKLESRNTGKQLELRDEMNDHVYNPIWMGDPPN